MIFRKIQLLLFICLIILFSGCATKQIAPEKVDALKKVGVISVAAHEFHRRYTGLTVFGNEEEKMDIDSWKVDDEYEKQMLTALSKLGLFKVVIVPYDRKAFYEVYNINGPWDAPAFRKEWVNIEDQARTLAQENELDAIVMIIWHIFDDVFAHTNQRLRGAGLYARGVGDVTSVSVIHLLSSLGVIDGKTGKPLITQEIVFKKEVKPEISRSALANLDQNALKKMLINLPKDDWELEFRKLFINDKK